LGKQKSVREKNCERKISKKSGQCLQKSQGGGGIKQICESLHESLKGRVLDGAKGEREGVKKRIGYTPKKA